MTTLDEPSSGARARAMCEGLGPDDCNIVKALLARREAAEAVAHLRKRGAELSQEKETQELSRHYYLVSAELRMDVLGDYNFPGCAHD